jgi:hypothetical protein
MVLILISLFQFILFQENSNLVGKWEQVNSSRIGFKETMEFTNDSVTIKEEFFSKNRFETVDNNLRVTKADSNGNKEVIIESEFYVDKDTLIFSKENGKIKDKMVRISGRVKENNLLGLWEGKTNKGVVTYLSFNKDGSSFYDAVIQSEKFKYIISSKGMAIFIHNNPRIVEYEIKNDLLKILYKDTGEEFNYRRTKEIN